jgi:precorrin-4 methylase
LLLASGYAASTPCAIAHSVSWPEELLDTCMLAELGRRLGEHGLERNTIVLVGAARSY